MFKDFAINFLQLLRSPRVRRIFAELFERLSSASIVAAAWLFYAGDPKAQAVIPALLIVSVVFLFAALAAMRED